LPATELLALLEAEKPQVHTWKMIPRNHWVENLRCPQCGKVGQAELSMTDGQSWAVQMDRVPVGFKVVQAENSSNFYCSVCDRPVEA
jgi:hypothetical protein